MGIAGWSGAGKTDLVVRLLPALTGRGLRVSTIKHAHHGFDVDRPGKDSHAHRAAGAAEVLVSSARRWALMHELSGTPEAGVEALLARMTPVDLVLVEGYKRAGHDKIEVRRAAAGGSLPPLWPGDPTVVAVAADTPPPDGFGGPRLPWLDLADTPAIANFIVGHCGLGGPGGGAR